jgi:uncharacterized membrane protein YccC
VRSREKVETAKPSYSEQMAGGTSPDPSVSTSPRILGRLLADASRIERTQSDPIVSARNAIGVMIPLLVGTAVGSPLSGILGTIGGIQTAFADRPGPYRLRMGRMLITAIAAGITAGLATGLGDSIVASAILLTVCAFAAGQLLSVSPAAAQVGVAATASAIILGHLPAPPLQALLAGLAVFAGGLVQMLLAIVAWPLRRHGPERLALAALYSQIADLARHPISTRTGPPLGTAITDADAVLNGAGHDHGPSVEAYRILLDEAVRARHDLLVLAAYADRLHREGLLDLELLVRGALTCTADFLEEVAAALTAGRAFDGRVSGTARAAIAGATTASAAMHDSVSARAAGARLASLAGKLRAMIATTTTGAEEGRTDEDASGTAWTARLRNPVAVIQANLDLRSSALRHALRLAILLPLTDVITRLGGLERGYWVPLTILVVLRPDFSTTFQRGLLRGIGTIVGVAVGTVLVHLVVSDGAVAMILLLGVFFFLMRFAGPNNVGLSSVCLSALVVVLLSLAGFPAAETAWARSIDTLIGGALALVAALLWPVWERTQVADRLADLLAAYRDYLLVVVDSGSTRERRSAARSNARLARSNAEASVDRARSEPVDAHGAVGLGDSVLAHSHRVVHALMAIDATRRAHQIYGEVDDFKRLVDASAAELGDFCRALKQSTPPEGGTSLRPLRQSLAVTLTDRALAESEGHSDAVIEATDRLVNGLDTLADVLRTRLALVVAANPAG